MTAVCTSDRWSCPHCPTTLLRGDEPAAVWVAKLPGRQVRHATRCKGGVRL